VKLQRISADWNCPVVVAATGPSLTAEVAARVRRARWPEEKCRVIAVNDAYRLLPYADILYACDETWWKVHIADVEKTFHGERWTTHEGRQRGESNWKGDMPAEWNVNLVAGKAASTFSTDPAVIHYGSNSGFQAVNLALLKGATQVVLVGFDMRVVAGRRHFFGDHPEPLHNRADYNSFIAPFEIASRKGALPIVNATPGSALGCFPRVDLDAAIAGWSDGGGGRDRADAHAEADRHCAA
jgi:hypothetical protein